MINEGHIKMMLKIDLASAKNILASNSEDPDIGRGLEHTWKLCN